jgi:hypothetical protein
MVKRQKSFTSTSLLNQLPREYKMFIRNAIPLIVLGLGYVSTANCQTSNFSSAYTSGAPLPDGPKYEAAVLLTELNSWYVSHPSGLQEPAC